MRVPHVLQRRRIIVFHPVGDELHILVHTVHNTKRNTGLSDRPTTPSSFLSTELRSVRWPSISQPLTNIGRRELWVNDTAIAPEEVARDALRPIKELLSVTNQDIICMIHPTDWDHETISTLDTSLRKAGFTSNRVIHVSRATSLLYAPHNGLATETTISVHSYTGPTLIYTQDNYAEVTFTEVKPSEVSKKDTIRKTPLESRRHDISSLLLPSSTMSGPFSQFADLKNELPEGTFIITGGNPSTKEAFLTASHLNPAQISSLPNRNLANFLQDKVKGKNRPTHVDDNQMLEGALRYLYARNFVDQPSKHSPVIGKSSNFKRSVAGLLSLLATFGGVTALISIDKENRPEQTERISTDNPYSISQNSAQKLDCRMIYRQLPLDIAARSHISTTFENIQEANENNKDNKCNFSHVDDGFNDHYPGRPLLVTGGEHSVVSSLKNGKLTEEKDYGDFYGWHQRKVSMGDADAPAIFSEHGDNSHGYLRFVTAMNVQNTDILGMHRTAIRGLASLGGHPKVSQGVLDQCYTTVFLIWRLFFNEPDLPGQQKIIYGHYSPTTGTSPILT